MANGTIGAGVLVLLVGCVVRPDKQKEVASPTFANMDQRHIFGAPRIELIEVFWRVDSPFFDVANDVFGRHCRFQTQSSQPLAHREDLSKREWRSGFPAAFTHSLRSLARK